MNRRAITTRTWEQGPHEWSGTTSEHFWYEVRPDAWIETAALVESADDATRMEQAAAGINPDTGIMGRTRPMTAATRYLQYSSDTLEFVA